MSIISWFWVLPRAKLEQLLEARDGSIRRAVPHKFWVFRWNSVVTESALSPFLTASAVRQPDFDWWGGAFARLEWLFEDRGVVLAEYSLRPELAGTCEFIFDHAGASALATRLRGLTREQVEAYMASEYGPDDEQSREVESAGEAHQQLLRWLGAVGPDQVGYFHYG